MDCDGLKHYLNFAPPGTRLDYDTFTYEVWGRSLLTIFNEFGIRATFFCIADQLNVPKIALFFREVVSNGHLIGNHTFSHPEMDTLSEQEYICEIRRAHKEITGTLGVIPRGFRAPAYFITAAGLRELNSLGYYYDSSICYSKCTRGLLLLLGIIRKNIRIKKQSNLHSKCPQLGPYTIEFEDNSRLLEWPISRALGFSYYGTLHCAMPSILFQIQTLILESGERHIHYELHPIELVSLECIRDFPWLGNLPFAGRRDLYSWLKCRIRRLTARRQVTTLEELSASYLRFCF
ncbi:MAG: polysaccharide deacetylase family protein [Thermodesulfobacteriota bacterium]